jgi:large repetitive protein
VVDLPAALADGSYTVQASQGDMAGNTGYSYSNALTVDTTPPQTFLDAAPSGVTSSTTASFSFHGTDALSQAGMTFECQLDGGAWGLCSSPVSYYNLANGSHTFSVEAVDGAGNLDTTGRTTTWTINTALPAIMLGSPADGSFTNDTTPAFSGTAGTAPGDSSTVHVLVYSNTDLSGSPIQTLSTTAGAGGAFSVSAATLSDGTYVAYAQQSGTAGTANSVAHTFTVDTQLPTTTITSGPPGASGTGDAAFSFTSSEAGSRFQCQLDGGGWIACSSPQDYFGLADGSHTFQVRSIDRAGNVGSPASQMWTVNSNLPALSLASPSDGTVTNNSAPLIAGTGGIASGDAGGVTVKIYSGTGTSGAPLQTWSTPVSSADGSWSTHPSPGLPDGTYSVYATQDGAAGTAYTSARTFTINTAPPTTAIISGPEGTTSATSARFAFTSSEAGSTFQCQLDGGAWTSCSSPKNYSGLTVGQHTFSVQATDPAGNADPNPPVASWTIDTVTNVPVTITAPADGTVTNNSTPTFSGTSSASNSNAISVEIDDANGDPVEILSAASGNSWSVPASPALPDGSYTAFASQLGSDGVTTDYSAVVGFTVDTTPPATTILTGPQGTTSATSAQFTFTSSQAGSTFQCKLDAAGWSTCSSPQTVNSLALGTHTFSVRAIDPAGNVDPSPASVTWTVDTPANVPLTWLAPANGALTNGTPTFSGTAGATNGNGISVQIDDASGNPVEILSASGGSSWSVQASPSLPDGSYTAFASQLGSDGVTTDYTTVIGFTVDATPPAVSLTSAPAGTSNDNTPSFAGAVGTASGDLPGVTLNLYSGTSTSGTPVQSVPATVSGGSWSAAATALPDGTYTARAQQSDTAGNTGYSAKRTFTIDTSTPHTSITAGPSASTTATSATFSFASSKTGSTFQCQLDGSAWTGCSSPASYTGLAVGAHTFTVRATDSLGNVDPSPASLSWTIVTPQPPSGGTPPPSSPAPPPGTTPPPANPNPGANNPSPVKLQLTLSARGVQHLSPRAALTVAARCSKACALVLSGKIVFTARGKLARHTKPRTMLVSRLLVKNLAAGKTVKLTFKLSARTRKAILAALVKKQRLTLTLTGIVTAPGMTRGTASVTVRLVP